MITTSLSGTLRSMRKSTGLSSGSHKAPEPLHILAHIRALSALTLLAAGLFFFTSCNKDDPKEEIVLPPCDSGIALDNADALNGARAVDLCRETLAQGDEWGVIEARYIRANGTDAPHSAQVGITSSFGQVTPRRGERLLVLSTGRARTPNQPGFCGSSGCTGSGLSTPPTAYPLTTPGCPAPSGAIYDDAGLEITLRAPRSAKGFSVDFIYYTFEYPAYLCSQFNDQFYIIMDPAPSGSLSGNIAFNDNAVPITVNSSYISTGNDALLSGTGFDGALGSAACTGWIRAAAPVEGGQEFTLRFIIWDSGDQVLDATVVLDNFQWLTTTTVTGTSKL